MSSNKGGLILDDNYLFKVKQYVSDTTGKASMRLNKLIDELERVTMNGVAAGETSEALKMYVNIAKEYGNIVEQFGKDYVKELSRFQKRIDEIDNDLY